ncbi:unnamed protein product [Rhizoctonia solani]|uniref:F-box domain-containing protein n=1 Tax=Rhizoctonia solani TaxID=456999 RepID=A0A8H3HL91_9AGAM|nr:unnamed protein product [Rhizoctonia solani]
MINLNVQRWEDLGQQLETVIAAYLDASIVLESSPPSDSTSVCDLVRRVEHRLDSYSSLLSERLASARLSITRTRNRLVSPVHRLPDEVLLKIMRIAIYSIDVKEPRQLSCEYTVRTIYRRLHAFIGVCSVWRRVGLDSNFWSVVPILDHPSGRYMTTAAQLSLERAANRHLHLVACLNTSRPDIKDFVISTISQHGRQFDTINIYSDSNGPLFQIIDELMSSIPSERSSIKNLLLYYFISVDRRVPDSFVGTFEPITHPTRDRRLKFERLMESLQVLHMCGVLVPFEGLSFRNLVQLKLQAMRLTSNLVFESSIRALASAPNLQKLDIISVSLEIWTTEDGFMDGPPIILPSLQHLYFEGVTALLLQLTLRLISPGSHLVTVNWTKKGHQSMQWNPASFFSSEIDSHHLKVDILLINGDTLGQSDNMIRAALEAFPTIKTLHLDSFLVNSGLLGELVSNTEAHESNDSESHTHSSQFPKLKTLYISRSHVHDPEVLRDISKVVANHPLEELGIGISLDCMCSPLVPSHEDSQDALESEVGAIWNTLAGVVPRMKLLPAKASEISSIAFENHVWQL